VRQKRRDKKGAKAATVPEITVSRNILIR